MNSRLIKIITNEAIRIVKTDAEDGDKVAKLVMDGLGGVDEKRFAFSCAYIIKISELVVA